MLRLFFIALFFSGQAMAIGQAAIDGAAAGQTALGISANQLQSGNGVNQLNATASDPAAVSNLQNTFGASNAGNVGLGSFGTQKVNNCANYVPTSNQANNQECAAVNELASNPVAHAVAATGLNASDPMFTNPNNMYNQGMFGAAPSTSIGSGTPQSGVTGAGACVQATSTSPATFTDQTCTRSAVANQKLCVITMSCTTNQPAPIPATVVNNCGTGYTWNGTTCTGPATAANPVYSCSSGTLSGTLCYYPAYQPAGSAATATAGWTQWYQVGVISVSYSDSGSGVWVYPVAATPLGYNVTPGNVQVMYAVWSATICAGAISGSTSDIYGSMCIIHYPTTTYSCPSGYTLSGSTCYPPLVTPPPTAATLTGYTCPSGSVLSGTSCIPTTSSTITYTCGQGMTLSGTTCIPLPVLVESFTNTCTQYQNATANPSALPATSVNGVYECPTGKTLNGSNCI